MPNLIGDVLNRVRRLPKPSNIADSLQPVFEAVSNAIHAVDDRYGEASHKIGRIAVSFSGVNSHPTYTVTISDNGIGLEDDRYRAFCTTDTPYKLERGGKGVGRLLWLDAFEKIEVSSVYMQDGDMLRRSFQFSLATTETIENEKVVKAETGAQTGTVIKMVGLRDSSYAAHMPTKFSAIVKHFGSHFLADFLLGKAPSLTVDFGKDSASFPEAVMELLVQRRASVEFETESFGILKIDGYEMKPSASADLDGSHQLHMVSSGRTVQTRKIDGLIGVKRIGTESSNVLHLCVTGSFLDERVNQERTHFNFSESVAEEITKLCATEAKTRIIGDEAQGYETHRLGELGAFIELYPSFGFEAPKNLLSKMPVNADNPEAFAKALIPHKIRADKQRREHVQTIVDRLTSSHEVPASLGEEIRKVAEEASRDEGRQLMEYVIRRKFIIEILQALLGRVKQSDGEFETHLEDTFHQLICPMRVVSGGSKFEPVSHDLWLLDERLGSATYFASDAPLKDFVDESGTARVDLMVWDKVHGLGLGPSDKLDRVMLVEFKRPERKSYKHDYVITRQMNRYMESLKAGRIRSYNGDFVELSSDVVFHCYVVADIQGDIKSDTQSWHDSPSGRGKFQYLSGDFRGTMEVIEWKELVRDAMVRNQNFLEAARLSFSRKGDPIFSERKLPASAAAE